VVLRVVAHKDGTLVVSGDLGGRELAPGDRERRSFRPYDPLAFASSDSQRYRHASACYAKYKT
jgi:hypothetical protein